MQQQPEPRYLAVGRVQRPHGVCGELRVMVLTAYPEQLSRLKTLYLGQKQRPYPLEGVRLHQKAALIKLAGIDDRNAADELRGAAGAASNRHGGTSAHDQAPATRLCGRLECQSRVAQTQLLHDSPGNSFEILLGHPQRL